jgi:hypothetical protein
MNINNIIYIQKFIRGYLIRKNILIPSSCYQTKKWRNNREWYKNGKNNECEKYQIILLEKILGLKINKTFDRINFESIDINDNRNPVIYDNGYEWSENFDGKIIKNNNIVYFNLKFICDNGGAQTRSLREVYNFIKYQIKYLIKYDSCNIYFINILDGDTCYNNMNKFMYLLNKNKIINKYIFIGDTHIFYKNKYIFNL